jgi:hypothetical protein
MADLSPSASTVTWVSGTRPLIGTAGATFVPGQPVYLDTTTNTYKLADADTDTESVVAGVTLDSAISGRPFLLAPPGAVINIGATVVLGTIYVLSINAGGIAPWADIGTGDYPVVLFIGATSNLVELICKKQYAGVHA